MNEIIIPSYAKINLTLEVLRKRDDGYHDIDSVVQVIELADRILIKKAEHEHIRVSTQVGSRLDVIPSGEGNLVYQACRAFLEFTGVRAGVECAVEKRIPVQAGLGGGSSNAASVIMALNRLFGCGLSVEQMTAVAASVGSDAALFIHGGTTRISGRGEHVRRLPDAPGLDLVAVKPGVGVSTSEAYAVLDRSGTERHRGASDEAETAIRAGDRAALVESLANDFDSVISGLVNEVAEAKQHLADQGARRALLTGSGSAVFGVFDSFEDAENAAAVLRNRFDRVFAARSLSRERSLLPDE